jgi:hypothetical protein
MSQFTTDEEQLILYYTRSRGLRDWLGYYLAFLFAPLAMAVYGFVQKDVLAMSIAYLGRLVMVICGVSSSAKDWGLIKSICVKLASTMQHSNAPTGASHH